MRTRFLLFFVLAILIPLCNVTAAGNIAHGVRVVVIDAGHGGNDPGACYGGVREKTINLQVALRVGKLIEEEMPGVKVVYTRKTDAALSPVKAEDLQARADVANKAGGDLFLSIHVNAAGRSTGVRGVETLIMGETPKEQRYNENALFDNNRDELIDMSDERTAAIVRAYIQNLQFTYGEYSMAFARCIQNSYQHSGRTLRGIKPQLLRVLYATDMPGVLTEIGFLSNTDERNYLCSDAGQEEVARDLLGAVQAYSKHLLYLRGEESGEPLQPDTVQVVSEDQDSAQLPVVQPQPQPEKRSGGKPTQKTNVKPVATQSVKVEKADDPVRYTVQVLSATRAVKLNSSEFKSYRNQVTQYNSDGTFRYKYGVGEFDDRAEAQRQLQTVRKSFPKAFVVKCQGGKIIN